MMTEFADRVWDAPIFICGHPKSGTSLLRNLLDGHPELVVYPEESSFFRRYLPLASGKSLDEMLTLADQQLTHFFDWNLENPPEHQKGFPDRDYSAISAEEIRACMRNWLGTTYRHPGDVLAAAVLAYGEVAGQLSPDVRAWVDKTPFNEFYAEQIFSLWPQARCVHIVRDPRDNYASYRRKHPEWSLVQFAHVWRRSTRAGWYNQQRFGCKRYRLLRYEDLLRKPEQTLRELTAFLGISWHESLLSPVRAGRQWKGNSMFGDQFNAISAAPIGRWRQALNAREVGTIEYLLKAWMKQMQYPLESREKHPSLWVAKIQLLRKELYAWLKNKPV